MVDGRARMVFVTCLALAMICLPFLGILGQTVLDYDPYMGVDNEWNRTEDLGWAGTADNWADNTDGNFPNTNTERANFDATGDGEDCIRTADDVIHSIIMAASYTSTLSFGSYTMTIERGGAADGDDCDLRTGGTINEGTGKIKFNSSYGSGNFQRLYSNAGDTLPHIEHTGSDQLRLQNNIVCLSFTQTDGTLNLQGYDITTVGNFTVTKAAGTTAFSNLGGATVNVGGSATFTGLSGDSISINPGSAWDINANTLNATYAVIGNSDARGGAVGAASLSRNATPATNYNWSFGATGKRRWDGGGGDDNWNTDANWDPNTAPGISDTAAFDGTSDDSCNLNVSATIAMLLFTSAYDGEFNFGAETLSVLSGDADMRSGGNFIPGSGAIKLSGTGTQVLRPRVSDTLPAILHSGSGTLQLANNDLFATGFVNSNGKIDFNSRDVTIDGDFSITNGDANTIYGSPSSLGGRTVTVSGEATFSGDAASDLNLNPTSMWYIGASTNLVGTFVNLANCSASVVTGAAANSTSGANVYRWVFGDYVWRGGYNSDNWGEDWLGNTNWTPNGSPPPGTAGNQNVVVVFNSSSNRGCVMNISPTVESVVFTGGYAGQFNFNGNTLTLTDAVANFSSGGTFAGTGTITLNSASTQDFTPKPGQTFPNITHTGAGALNVNNSLTAGNITQSSGAGTWNWGSTGKTHTVSALTATSGTMNFGNSTVKASGNVTFNNLGDLGAGSGILELTSTGTQSLVPVNGDTLPQVLHSGTGTLQITTRELACESFTNNAGIINIGQNIRTVSNFTINNGVNGTFSGNTLGGKTLIVVGNASFNGTSGNLLNLNPTSAWSVNATGACNASYANINNSTASGVTGYATASTQGPTTTNWVFGTEISSIWHQSLSPAIADAAMGNGAIYCARSTNIEKRDVDNGTTTGFWTYNCGQTTTGLTYYYDSGADRYVIVYSAGTYVGAVRDNGAASYTVLWGPTNYGATVSRPYIEPGGTNCYFTYSNSFAKRVTNTGAVVWTKTLSNADTDADISVHNNAIYVANTSGTIYKYDNLGTPGLSRPIGTGIDQPLLVLGNTLYAAPTTNVLKAVNSTTMNLKWTSSTLAANVSGGMWVEEGTNYKIYVAAGSKAYRLTDNGTSGTIDANWPYDAGATIKSGPILFSGNVYFGRTSGRYYSLDDSDASLNSQWPHVSVAGDADLGPWIDVTNPYVIFSSTGGDFDAFNAP